MSKWITDRLPSDDNKVLCLTATKSGGRRIVIGCYVGGMWHCGFNNNVVGWLPLPEAYEGQNR